MNKPIARLFVVVLVMFALLVGFTSRWTVFEASALRANPLEQGPRARGPDRAARRDRRPRRRHRARPLACAGANGFYVRDYPFGALFASPIGYYDPYNGSSQLERYRNGVLAGAPPQQSSILDQLEGKLTDGDEVVTTLDAHAQQVAYRRPRRAPRRGRRDRRRAPARSVCSRRPRATTPTTSRARPPSSACSTTPPTRCSTTRTQAQYAPGLDVQGRDRDRRDRHAAA